MTLACSWITSLPPSIPRRQGHCAARSYFWYGTSLPPVSAIADSLINDLAELGREFILVLDDLQVIHDADIYSLLAALLRHPPQGMHLILLTRQDPPLALGHLRAMTR